MWLSLVPDIYQDMLVEYGYFLNAKLCVNSNDFNSHI